MRGLYIDECHVLLKQSNIYSVRLSETIGVSDAQLEFVKNSQSGTAIKAFWRMADKKLNNR